jgi:hypothetical protein
VFDLEATNAELKSDLRDLYITKAEEIDGKSGRKAIIIHVRSPCQCKGGCAMLKCCQVRGAWLQPPSTGLCCRQSSGCERCSCVCSPCAHASRREASYVSESSSDRKTQLRDCFT